MKTHGSSDDQPFRYDARLAGQIEAKWQRRWAADGTFESPNPSGPLSAGFGAVAGRPTCYVVDMFPYPSGAGLHVGHPLGYIASDVYARFARMTGAHVLHAFGFDTFGLPAEQHAISTGRHPAETVAANVAIMRGQLRRLGLGHDPRREIITSDPRYYRWTQWIFLRLYGSWCDERTGRARPVTELVAEYENGDRRAPDGARWAELTAGQRRELIDARRLAYLSDELVNWCPGLGTVLANEEVTEDGRSDVGNFPVYQRPARQWMLRITAFAARLAADLDLVDWPEPVRQMQRNWIGAAAGAGRGGAGEHRMHDWLFSRQRYWGEPFPIVYDPRGQPVPLPDDALPVELPELADFRPVPSARSAPSAQSGDEHGDPVPPLARAGGWASVEIDLGDGNGPVACRRELNTMPQWAGSCWYYLRYLDPANETAIADPAIERYWMAGGAASGVDLYLGGAEHAVLHLLYARFWHKVLYDLGYVSTPEPFGRLVNQGYIMADAFTDERGMYVPAAEVTEGPGGSPRYRGRPVTRRTGKMGKSLKNGVSPDDICRDYGADTLRLQEMATGPIEASRPWRTDDIAGVHRFLRRLWRAIIDERTGAAAVGGGPPGPQTLRLLHRTIAVVREDMAALRFNTAVSRLMELTAQAARDAAASGGLPREIAEPLVLMVAPLAPHIAEELWERLGHGRTLAFEPFPEADPGLAADQVIGVPVQVNGRTRFVLEVRADADAGDVERTLRADPRFARLTGELTVRRLVIVPGRIVNVLAG